MSNRITSGLDPDTLLTKDVYDTTDDGKIDVDKLNGMIKIKDTVDYEQTDQNAAECLVVDALRVVAKKTIDNEYINAISLYLKQEGTANHVALKTTIRKVSDEALLASEDLPYADEIAPVLTWYPVTLDPPVYVNEEVYIGIEMLVDSGDTVFNCVTIGLNNTGGTDECYDYPESVYTVLGATKLLTYKIGYSEQQAAVMPV